MDGMERSKMTWKCPRCGQNCNGGHYEGWMKPFSFICDVCYAEWVKIWNKFITAKFPPDGARPFYYINWTESEDKAKLFKAWSEQYIPEEVSIT
jgi:hypothetical protein